MSSKSHESQGSYVDNLRVKISERYKPPRKINLAMSYSQRLTLNKHIQDAMPNYEFLLEKSVLEKMKEWKNARQEYTEEKRARLEKAKEDFAERKLETIESEKTEEIEVKTVTTNDKNYLNYNSNILVPMQSAYSNILTPMPLSNTTSENYHSIDKKRPFNYSDFEDDTSSPFDNMELKSINDLEELAQVLKSDKPNPLAYNNVYQNVPATTYQNVITTTANIQPSYSQYNNFSYIPSTMSYINPTTSNYSYSNGYYYDPSMVNNVPNTSYSKQSINYTNTSPNDNTLKKSNCKSVPDIVKSLQQELDNTHLDDQQSFITNNAVVTPTRPKSTDAVYPKPKVKENLDDPFYSLPKKQQHLCISISNMGFPLSRVARVCKVLGEDHKKIVEHLLALSDLLDLGFPEKEVSSALIQCENDRDRALDKLIT